MTVSLLATGYPARAQEKAKLTQPAGAVDAPMLPLSAVKQPQPAKPAQPTAPISTGSINETQTKAPAAAVTAPTAQPAVFGDWVLRCAGMDRSCALHQRLADQKGRKIVTFKAARSADALYLEVNAPLGLSIPFGVALVMPDKTELRMELADCGPTGCRAVAPLEPATLVKFTGQERIGVRFQDSKSGKVVTIHGSLRGFAQGIVKVQGAG